MPDASLETAFVHSLLAGGVGTGLGALPVLLLRNISPATESAFAGFSAGVMLAASFVALLLPAFEMVPGHGVLANWPVLAGVALGALLIALVHRLAPHEHFQKGVESAHGARLARVWLFAIALALHNFPEGLAIGVGVASGDEGTSLPITLAIGAQNVPEGLIVAFAFVVAGHRRRTALLVTIATGLIEPIGAIAGYAALQLATAAMPAALAFAAGAMIWVVSHEIIPESHREGRSAVATAGLVVGVLAMLQIDSWLG